MSVLAYPRTNDEEIFRHCTKDCGMVTATDDFQYFALRCIFCSEKFLYFDSFIGHMQTVHLGDQSVANTSSRLPFNLGEPMSLSGRNGDLPNFHEIEDLTDADTALLEPQMVIKQELQDLPCSDDDVVAGEEDDDEQRLNDSEADEDEAILPESDVPVVSSKTRARKKVTKQRQRDMSSELLIAGDGDSSMDDYGDPDHSYMDDNSGEYMDFAGFDGVNHSGFGTESDFLSYDEMVEESLLGVSYIFILYTYRYFC